MLADGRPNFTASELGLPKAQWFSVVPYNCLMQCCYRDIDRLVELRASLLYSCTISYLSAFLGQPKNLEDQLRHMMM